MRGTFEAFKQIGTVIIGISKDSTASQKKFAGKYGLPFILLSDPELTAIQAYGVRQEKKLYGKVSMGVVRSTFIIDENGVIEKIVYTVDHPDHRRGSLTMNGRSASTCGRRWSCLSAPWKSCCGQREDHPLRAGALSGKDERAGTWQQVPARSL